MEIPRMNPELSPGSKKNRWPSRTGLRKIDKAVLKGMGCCCDGNHRREVRGNFILWILGVVGIAIFLLLNAYHELLQNWVRPPSIVTIMTGENVTGKLYFNDRVLGDWRHASLLYEAVHQTFAGLRLNKLASSGVYVSPEERRHLAQFLGSKGQLNDTVPYHHELLPRLIEGDRLESYNGMEEVLDQHFVFDTKPQALVPRFCDEFVSLLQLAHLKPLVVALSTFTTFDFTLRCLHERREDLLNASRQFVLLTTDADYSSSFSFFSPKIPHNVRYPNVNVSYLIDHPLLAHWFTTNMDVRHPKVSSVPLGMYTFYNRGNSLWEDSPERFYSETDGSLTESMLDGLDLTALFPHVGHPVTLWKRRVVWLEDALELFTDNVEDPPVDWVPLSSLPARVTRVVVVLMPLEAGKSANRPSLTSEVLVFRESGEGVTEASQSVALLPFTAALYHRLQQRGFGSPQRDPRVLVAFGVHAGRYNVYKYLEDHPELSVEAAKISVIERKKAFFQVAENMMFVMSPPGYGYECYRTWESLFVGAIPIVMEPKSSFLKVYHTFRDDTYQRLLAYGAETDPSAFLEVYKDLPVVVVQDVSEITLESVERWRSEIYAKMQRGEYKLEKLFSQTWLDEIYGFSSGRSVEIASVDG